MAVLLLLSKGVGLLREVAVAHTFGADLVKDANTVAYYIPAFFLIMLGGLNGPFHLATMGAVTRLKAQGVAVLLVEQKVEAALEVADRVAFIENGVIKHLSTPGDVAADPAPLHRYVGVRR